MIIDQSKECPFFDYIDNDTDNELVKFIEGRSTDTDKFKKVAKKKIAELQKAIAVCERLEQAS